MRRLIFLLAILFLLCAAAFPQATDTYIGACAAQPACTLATGVSWVNGNQIWRFTAYSQNESIRIWIHNNNTTNAHTSQTVQAWITDESSVANLSTNADRWVQAAITDNSTAGAQCANVAANNPLAAPGANGKATCYTAGMYATQIAIRITGAAAQAGAPDTFDIGIVQQPSTYPSGPQPGNDTSAGGGTAQFAFADSVSNTQQISTGSGQALAYATFPFGWNGTTWDRQRNAKNVTDAASSANALWMLNSSMAWNGASYDRVRAGVTADASAATGFLNNAAMLFNGTTYDRMRGSQNTVGVPALVSIGSSTDADADAATGFFSGVTTSAKVIGRMELFNNSTWDRWRSITGAVAAGTGNAAVSVTPTSATPAGIVPVVSTSAESNHILKASAGNLYSLTITTGASAGLLMIFNATTAPADGAVTPQFCADVAATSTLSVNFSPIPSQYSTGITAVFSTGTNCFNKAASATAFFSGSVM